MLQAYNLSKIAQNTLLNLIFIIQAALVSQDSSCYYAFEMITSSFPMDSFGETGFVLLPIDMSIVC